MRANLRLNGIRNARARPGDDLGVVEGFAFDVILSNPPIHAGWKVVGAMMDQAHEAAALIQREVAAVMGGAVAQYRAALQAAGYTPFGGGS